MLCNPYLEVQDIHKPSLSSSVCWRWFVLWSLTALTARLPLFLLNTMAMAEKTRNRATIPDQTVTIITHGRGVFMLQMSTLLWLEPCQLSGENLGF